MADKEPVKLNQNIAGEIARLREEISSMKWVLNTIKNCVVLITVLIVFPLILYVLFLLGMGSK